MKHLEEVELMRAAVKEFEKFLSSHTCGEQSTAKSNGVYLLDTPLMAEDGKEKFRTVTVVLVSEAAGFSIHERIREGLLKALGVEANGPK